MTPPPPKKTKKKYPQILNTQKIFIFLKTPKDIKIQNFEPPKNPEPTYVWKYQSNPPGATVCQYHYLFNLWRSQSCHQKEKLQENQNSNRTHGLDSVMSLVQCHVQLYQMTSSSSCTLAIWSLWTKSMMRCTKIEPWRDFQRCGILHV